MLGNFSNFTNKRWQEKEQPSLTVSLLSDFLQEQDLLHQTKQKSKKKLHQNPAQHINLSSIYQSMILKISTKVTLTAEENELVSPEPPGTMV